MTDPRDRTVRQQAATYVRRKDGDASVPEVMGALRIEPTEENVAAVRAALGEGDK